MMNDIIIASGSAEVKVEEIVGRGLYWSHQTYCEGDLLGYGTVKEMTQLFHTKMEDLTTRIGTPFDVPVVGRRRNDDPNDVVLVLYVSTGTRRIGSSPSSSPSISVKIWNPYVCSNEYGTNGLTVKFPLENFFWTRCSSSLLRLLPNNNTSSLSSSTSDDSTKEKEQQQWDILFDIVLSLNDGAPHSKTKRFLIEHLGNDMALHRLYKKLTTTTQIPTMTTSLRPSYPPPSSMMIESLEVVSKNQKQDEGRTLQLCTMLVQNNTLSTLRELFIENLNLYPSHLIHNFLQAFKTNTCLEVLDLRTSRYIHTWKKHIPIQRKKPTAADLVNNNNNNNFALHILSSCTRRNSSSSSSIGSSTGSTCSRSLIELDLSGNLLYFLSASRLAKKVLPHLTLKILLLRDTELQEDVLIEIIQSLAKDTKTTTTTTRTTILQELDLSQNVFTPNVTKVLCSTLQENTTLKRLTMDHCNVDLEQAQYLATSLPDMKGLQYWSLDGNDFTWNPTLHGLFSVGATAIVNALEYNHVLLSLSVGESGKIMQFSTKTCCSLPRYKAALDQDTQLKLDQWLERNRTNLSNGEEGEG